MSNSWRLPGKFALFEQESKAHMLTCPSAASFLRWVRLFILGCSVGISAFLDLNLLQLWLQLHAKRGVVENSPETVLKRNSYATRVGGF